MATSPAESVESVELVEMTSPAESVESVEWTESVESVEWTESFGRCMTGGKA